MIDERDLFVRASLRFEPPSGALEAFTRRRRRSQRNRRVGALVVAVIVIAVVFGGLSRAILRSEGTPASPPSIFDGVHGWIAVNTASGVEAVDPSDPTRTVVLTTAPDIPVAWARDGSQLLMISGWNLSVLRSDGSIVPVPKSRHGAGIGFTPDGEVLFVRRSLYAADLATGRVRTVATPSSKKASFHVTSFSGGQLSPDGTTLVLTGSGPPSARGAALSLLDVRTGRVRTLVTEARWRRLHPRGDLRAAPPGSWSPDGTRIAFTMEGTAHDIVAVVGADGSNLTSVTQDGLIRPSWSPDGSRLAGIKGGAFLQIVNVDGSDLRSITIPQEHPTFMWNAAWNPVPEA